MPNQNLIPRLPSHPWVIERQGRRLDLRRRVHGMFGLAFDEIDMAGTVAQVRQCVQRRERCFMSTVNLNFTITSQHHEAVRTSLLSSDLVVVDGMPLVWTAKAMGIPIRERVAGSDLFDELQRTPNGHTDAAMRVYFFGGEDGVAAKASDVLNARESALRCVGFSSPGFVSMEAMSQPVQLDAINRTHADFLAVSIGAAKGQAWILANQDRLSAPVISYLGAVVNFVAGHVERAPVAMRQLGLEWLWRILAEPAIWRRYAHDGMAFAKLLRKQVWPAWRRQRRLASAQAKAGADEHGQGTIEVVPAKDSVASDIVCLRGAWRGANLDPLRDATAAVLRQGKAVRWDLTRCSSVGSDLVGLALLIEHFQSVRLAEQPNLWPQDVKRAFGEAGAESLLARVS